MHKIILNTKDNILCKFVSSTRNISVDINLSRKGFSTKTHCVYLFNIIVIIISLALKEIIADALVPPFL